MRRAVALGLAAGALAGCATQRAYEGPAQPRTDVARIEGAPRVNAGLPVAAVLRKVDRTVVRTLDSGAEVLPGTHTLLVDCLVYDSHSTTRFELTLEAEAGGRYRLVAETEPGNRRCAAVHIESR